MPKLDREQRGIVAQINREARNVPRPLRKIFKRAAVQTGLVESGLRNLSYGDADSQGWRQERASLYKDPTNVKASVARFRQEFLQQYDPGEKAWQVAAQVQRPAAQYRDRYRDVAPEARQILRQYGGGGGVVTGYREMTTPGVDNSGLRQDLKLQYLQNKGKPNALLDLAGGLESAQDVAGTTTRVKVKGQGGDPVEQGAVDLLKSEAEKINDAQVPYLWGGGHQTKQPRGSKVTPLDCSGAVSRVLGINPKVSGQFEGWGKAGKGRRVTIYANSEHVLMEIDGHFWGTSKSNPGGGAGWIPRKQLSKQYLSRFTARHPPGM